MRIVPMTETLLKKTLPLITEYQRFYEVPSSAEKNLEYFSKFLADQTRGVQFVAVDDSGVIAGFATLYFCMSSLKPGEFCLLNDLYVDPIFRGEGIGRGLIEASGLYARERGFTSIEWHTQLANVEAQRLYNSMGARKSGWYHYELGIKP